MRSEVSLGTKQKSYYFRTPYNILQFCNGLKQDIANPTVFFIVSTRKEIEEYIWNTNRERIGIWQ